MRILIVEDDAVLADGLTRTLRQSGYAADCANNGEQADSALSNENYDVVILDLGLPGMDGLEVLRRLRTRKSTVPVLILTARDALDDRVRGLDLGADDYMVKPFDPPELEARLRALLRRGQASGGGELRIGELSFDAATRCARIGKQIIELSPRELSLLEVLMRRAGKVVGKEQLLEHLYTWDEEATSNAIEVLMHRLRRKLDQHGVIIRTVRGLGYMLDSPEV
ncbi:MAG: response regulator transcription factor [Sulfuricella sp.]|nr:response regulator transcription factor [Sulfuricella sp.]